MDNQVYKDWYCNEDIEKRRFISWEILKETRSHSTDMINIDDKISALRFQAIGNFNYLISKFIPSMFVSRFENNQKVPVEHPNWHYFRSIQHIRLTNDGNKADIKLDFDNLAYGWDLILDFDNKLFKEHVNKLLENEGGINSNIIDKNYDNLIKVMIEGISIPYQETKRVKEYLDDYNVPYILNFTGSGFRIAFYWGKLKDFLTRDDYGLVNKKLGKFIINNAFKGNKIKSFDTSTLGFGMGLTRTLYTIHPITKYLSYPIDDGEFNNFDVEMANPYKLLEKIKPTSSALPQNKQRNGDMARILNDFMQECSNNIDEHKLRQESEKIKYISKKEYILGQIKELPQKYKEELLQQIKCSQ